ncbi:MAG: hypothetical protein YSLV7_ORF12 [Yellowstone Lake virophage 7]|uniref:hypothetical protein n=1 Tax=Yellowstone Lake virophage 7 TaxID=1557035 RepID=UPI000535DFD4|nr:MAG: hypothetical protein ASQ67_gp12 [Yellowstone Lake virophage 7]AIW01931.1 MAG: hypothetical protein YSLV7_ORF12 [Yellowstone Lake virophage 7]
MEMVYLNPDKTSKEIADEINLISGEDPQYLKQVIRGYVMNMEKILQKIVKDVAKLNFAYSENNSDLYLKIHAKMGIFADWLLTMAEDRNTIVFEKDAQKKI